MLAKVKNLSEPIDLSMNNWVSAQHFQATGRSQEALYTPKREDSEEIKIMTLPEALRCCGKCRQGVPWRLSLDPEFRGGRQRMCRLESPVESKALISLLCLTPRGIF